MIPTFCGQYIKDFIFPLHDRSSFYLSNILESMINVIHVLCSFSILIKNLEIEFYFSSPQITF